MRSTLGLSSVILVTLGTGGPFLAAGESPGRMGVYVSFRQEVKSPEALRQTMKRIKATGIDFIHCSGKGHGVFWDSQIAPKELIHDPTYMEKVLQCAHEEGLKVYPVFCLAIEGGEAGPNILLQKNPSWAFYYEGLRRGYIDRHFRGVPGLGHVDQ